MRVVYMSIAGERWPAEIVLRRPDGRADLAIAAAPNDVVEVTRIEVVKIDELRPLTCAVEQGGDDGEEIEGDA